MSKSKKKIYCGEIKCKGACIGRQGAHNERIMCPFGALPPRSKKEIEEDKNTEEPETPA